MGIGDAAKAVGGIVGVLSGPAGMCIESVGERVTESGRRLLKNAQSAVDDQRQQIEQLRGTLSNLRWIGTTLRDLKGSAAVLEVCFSDFVRLMAAPKQDLAEILDVDDDCFEVVEDSVASMTESFAKI